MKNWKSITFTALVAIAAGATAGAHADPEHAAVWHGISAAATLASTYFGLTSPDVSKAFIPAPPPQPEQRL